MFLLYADHESTWNGFSLKVSVNEITVFTNSPGSVSDSPWLSMSCDVSSSWNNNIIA